VIRGAPLGTPSGRVYVVDADDGRVLGSADVPETPWAVGGTNPRGGHRGGRGIAASDGRLAIANADEIHVFDRSWRTVDVLTHSLVADIHELAPAPDGLWACSTRADSLVRVGWDGSLRERWSWRDDPGLVDAFGYRSVAPVDESAEYRDMRLVNTVAMDLSHLNGVLPRDDGLLVSLGRVRFPSPSRRERVQAAVGSAAQAAVVGRPLASRVRAERIRRFGADPQPGAARRGVVVRLRPGRPAEIVLERELGKWPNHNVVAHGRELVLCETSHGLVTGVDLDTGAERTVEVPGAASYVRGLAHLDGDRFLVGSRRPATVHTIDLGAARADGVVALSEEWHESVHDIVALPDDWDDLPPSLAR